MSVISAAAVQPAVAEPGILTLADWDQEYSQRDDAYELVQGVPTVSPNESVRNLVVAANLGAAIRLGTHREFVAPTQVSVTLQACDPPTVRRPDVIVCRPEVVPETARIDAADVELVVEVLSPSSIERDRVTKRDEYARAGIPAYLIVDRFAGRLMLFTDPRDGAYHNLTSTDGQAPLTIRLGSHTVEISLADLT